MYFENNTFTYKTCSSEYIISTINYIEYGVGYDTTFNYQPSGLSFNRPESCNLVSTAVMAVDTSLFELKSDGTLRIKNQLTPFTSVISL